MALQPFIAPFNEKSLEGFDNEIRDTRSATEFVSDVVVFHEPLPASEGGQGPDKAVAAQARD